MELSRRVFIRAAHPKALIDLIRLGEDRLHLEVESSHNIFVNSLASEVNVGQDTRIRNTDHPPGVTENA